MTLSPALRGGHHSGSQPIHAQTKSAAVINQQIALSRWIAVLNLFTGASLAHSSEPSADYF
jgi:hypothetical protein